MTNLEQVFTWLGSSAIAVLGIIWSARTPTKNQEQLIKANRDRDKAVRNQERIEQFYEPLISSISELTAGLRPTVIQTLGIRLPEIPREQESIVDGVNAVDNYNRLEIPTTLYASHTLYDLVVKWNQCLIEIMNQCQYLHDLPYSQNTTNERFKLKIELRSKWERVKELKMDVINQVREELGLSRIEVENSASF